MTACPRCGSPQDAPASRDENAPRRDLARVASIAEAGYLVSLLESAGLAATTRPVESFNAVTGAWSATHTVSVAEADVPIAAGLLRAESRGQNLEVVLGSADSSRGEGEPSSVNPWRMLAVLAVVAATGTLLAWNAFGDKQRARLPFQVIDADVPDPEPESLLAVVLRQQPGPYYSDGGPAGGRRRLAFSELTQAWTLSIDEDRDGRYETHRRFAVTPAVAE